jgi:hypothetical protein
MKWTSRGGKKLLNDFNRRRSLGKGEAKGITHQSEQSQWLSGAHRSGGVTAPIYV